MSTTTITVVTLLGIIYYRCRCAIIFKALVILHVFAFIHATMTSDQFTVYHSLVPSQLTLKV